jgi:hypothetical protein
LYIVRPDIQRLLELCAASRNNEGKTSLQIALKYQDEQLKILDWENEWAQVAQLLLQYGAKRK